MAPEAARSLQDRVVSVRDLASRQDLAGAAAALDALAGDVDTAAAQGNVSAERRQRIETALAQVRADLAAAMVPAPDPSPSAVPEPVPSPSVVPAPVPAQTAVPSRTQAPAPTTAAPAGEDGVSGNSGNAGNNGNAGKGSNGNSGKQDEKKKEKDKSDQ